MPVRIKKDLCKSTTIMMKDLVRCLNKCWSPSTNNYPNRLVTSYFHDSDIGDQTCTPYVRRLVKPIVDVFPFVTVREGLSLLH